MMLYASPDRKNRQKANKYLQIAAKSSTDAESVLLFCF
jgi:hypothetical protein